MTTTTKDFSVAEPHASTQRVGLNTPFFPYESRIIEVNGARVHYVDEGVGPVLLLLHPGPSSSFIYREFIQQLHNQFRCVAMDLPGFGFSEAPGIGDVTFEALSAAVGEFIQTLDLQDITLMVHDASGPIGLGAAVRDPGRYKAFILTDTLGFSLNDYPLVRVMLWLVTGGIFRWVNRRFNFLPWLVSTLAPVGRRLSKAERAIYLEIFPTPQSRDHILDLFAEILTQADYLDEVEEGIKRNFAEHPALIMYGQFDPTRLLGWMRRFQTLFPLHRSKVIPREGHFPHEGSPDTMIGEITDWHRTNGVN